MTEIYNKLEVKEKRVNLRNNLTKAEQILWSYLKGKQMYGLKFRRQFSFGFYIVDFYCLEKKIVIEVDGDSHASDNAILYDEDRTKFLNSLGVRVIRFTNDEIYKNIKNVLDKISITLLDPT